MLRLGGPAGTAADPPWAEAGAVIAHSNAPASSAPRSSASSGLAARATPERLHLLALAPQTGRTHQLRVHCAAHALPLLGDRAYGGASRLISATGAVTALDRIALHAAWVELPLPAPLRMEAATPAWLIGIWREFAGSESAFAIARELPLGA